MALTRKQLRKEKFLTRSQRYRLRELIDEIYNGFDWFGDIYGTELRDLKNRLDRVQKIRNKLQ